MYDKLECGKRLKRLRENTGKTQSEVAKELGISVDTVSKLEQGKRSPSVMVVDILSKYYNTTADYIIAGKIGFHNSKSAASAQNDKQIVLDRIVEELKDLIK